ncbi:MAG TPA: hypothetical protein VK980_03535 [Sphingomonas sp.]|nr:hypothetical protein [Sphingomonas sp.]
MALITLFLPILLANAAQEPQVRVGDVYEIVRTQEMSETSSDRSSSSSTDHDVLAERVVAVRDDGLELEYDLPGAATALDRAQDWHLPARIFKPTSGAVQLLNQAELEARIDPWLRAANWTRAICGQWIFTWNAFQIDCNPQTILATIAAFDLRPDNLHDGALHSEPDTLAPAPLRRGDGRAGGASFVVELAIDPDSVRRSEARADQVTGEIMRKPVTLDAAIQAHAAERIAGTMTITFETDTAGVVRKRTIVDLEIRKPDGAVVKRITTVTLARRRVVMFGVPATT